MNRVRWASLVALVALVSFANVCAWAPATWCVILAGICCSAIEWAWVIVMVVESHRVDSNGRDPPREERRW